MTELQWLLTGLQASITPENLFACLIGVLAGQMVGILPGLGPPGAMAIAMPLMFGRDPAQMLVMLFGIYYGAMYGGTITTVLMNIPGEASSVMTSLDGHQMAQQGRAGPALGIAAFGSFIAGIMGMLGLALAATSLSQLALAIGSVEYVAIVIFALGLVGTLAGSSQTKGVLSAMIGLALGTIGTDPTTGVLRFTFGLDPLFDGVNFVTVAVALFGMSEVLENLGRGSGGNVFVKISSWRSLLLSKTDWARALPAVVRGGVIGFVVGIVPGAGSAIATFFSYGVEKRLSRHPEEFGHGAIEGVAGPEACNNAAVCGHLVPMLSLGIPGSASTAILLSGLLVIGITPGPRLISQYPQIIWPAIASMVVGNFILLLLNVPLVGLSVQLLKAPYAMLAAGIVSIAALGVFSLRNDASDLWLLLFFTALGYLMRRADMPAAPLLAGMILCPLLERNLRRTLGIYETPMVLLTRPISAAFIAATVVVFIAPALLSYGGRVIAAHSAKGAATEGGSQGYVQ